MKHNKTMYYFIVWNFVPVQKGNPFLLTIVQVLPDVNMESILPKKYIDKFGRFTCKLSTCKIMPCVSSWPFDLAYVETIG